MKKIFFLLPVIIFFFLPNAAKACLGFGCKADAILLGEVISVENTIVVVRPFHIFPKSTVSPVDEIMISAEDDVFEIGKKYALSLVKNDDMYVPNWDVFEVKGTSYENVKLTQIKTGDDAWLQWWMNSNGEEPETSSYMINDALFFRIGNPESPFFQDIQVYPKPFFSNQMIYFSVTSFIVGASGTYLLTKKKVRQTL